METPLRLLIIEDSDRDVALEVRALEAAGYKVTYTVACTAAEMKAALAGQDFDIVISDHDLPQFDAPGALAVLKESNRDIPFIVVSGAIGEEMAVSLIKAGAYDYLMKDRLAHLASAVERALKDAENMRGLRQAENRILLSEERYRTLVDKSFEAIIVIQDGQIVFANPRAFEMIGLPPDQTEPKPFADFLHEEDRGEILDRQMRRLKGEQMEETYTIRLVDADGDIKWALIGTALIDWEGNPATLTFLTDITQRKKAEEALRESEERFRKIFEDSPISLWEEDFSAVKRQIDRLRNSGVGDFRKYFREHAGEVADFMALVRLVEVNKATLQIYQAASKEELLGNLGAVFGKQSYGVFAEEIIALAEGKTLFESEAITQTLAGNPNHILLKLVVAPGCENTLSKVFVCIIDITDRKQAERRLQESEALYRTLVETSPDAIGLMDTDGTIIMINRQALEVFGFDPTEDLRGRNIMDLVAPENYNHVLVNMEKLRQDKVLRNWEITSFKKDGSPFFLELSSSMLMDEEGNPKSVMTVFKDITERKLAEEKLLKSYASLKKTLNDSIATMVKIVELRDPYTAGHQQNVAALATAIAVEMKLEETRIEHLRTAAVIHDIGKMYVPSDILSKPGKLSDIEFSLIKTHARNGYDIVKGMDFPGIVAQVVLQHHERLDGSGYPNGIKGEEILLEAKILAVADVVEAMASDRPYRPSKGIDQALAEIAENRGRLYDPAVADACLDLFSSGRFEFKPA